MRTLLTLLLLMMASPLAAEVPQSIRDRQAERAHIEQVQERCEYWLMRYVAYSRYNRENINRYSWDNPNGFLDPSAINRSRYFFQDVSANLRDEIDQIQRSPNPTEEQCYAAANHAYKVAWTYTRDLLLNEQPGS